MKGLFEDYSSFIIGTISVILIVSLMIPVGKKITESTDSTIKDFETVTSLFLGVEPPNYDANVYKLISPGSDGNTEIVKGNLITIDNIEYRILDINRSKIKVLAMEDYDSLTFNSASSVTLFGETEGQKYEGSDLDNKMIEFYNSLSYKDAIVAQNINQSMYKFSDEPNNLGVVDPYKYQYQCDWDDSDWENLQYIGSANAGERYIYALDVDDVYDYVGKNTISSSELNDMFFKTTSSTIKYVWLRSASADDSDYAFDVYGGGGVLTLDYYDSPGGVRPAFVLDLNKLEKK